MTMRCLGWLVWLGVLGGVGGSGRAAAAESAGSARGAAGPAVLEVREGEFWRGGRVVRAVGVNYFDCFQRLLEFPAKRAVEPPEYVAGLDLLARHRIPFIRFAACGFYPIEWRLYRDHPEQHFAMLDRLVAEAGRRGIGLVPSMFWAHFAVPDLCGEPISAWGDAGSRTRAFMRGYTAAVVRRYRDTEAVWAWEFGNEYMNEADLGMQGKTDYWVVPPRATAARRTAADFPRSSDLIAAYRDFAETVRKLDPRRPVMTGDALLRGHAWHLARGEGWRPDSLEQWSEMVRAVNPDPVNTISAHIYHPRADGKGFAGYGLVGAPLADTVAAAVAAARVAGKPLWLGEFGPGGGEQDPARRRQQVDELLGLIERQRIGLAAYWVFDSLNRELGVWNATATNDNAYVLERIAAVNARLAGEIR